MAKFSGYLGLPPQASDIRDPNRAFINTNIGNVQAWRAEPAHVAVCVNFYAGVQHAPGGASYVSQTLNLTAEDARDLARVLNEAADHADKVRTDRVEEAA